MATVRGAPDNLPSIGRFRISVRCRPPTAEVKPTSDKTAIPTRLGQVARVLIASAAPRLYASGLSWRRELHLADPEMTIWLQPSPGSSRSSASVRCKGWATFPILPSTRCQPELTNSIGTRHRRRAAWLYLRRLRLVRYCTRWRRDRNGAGSSRPSTSTTRSLPKTRGVWGIGSRRYFIAQPDDGRMLVPLSGKHTTPARDQWAEGG